MENRPRNPTEICAWCMVTYLSPLLQDADGRSPVWARQTNMCCLVTCRLFHALVLLAPSWCWSDPCTPLLLELGLDEWPLAVLAAFNTSNWLWVLDEWPLAVLAALYT